MPNSTASPPRVQKVLGLIKDVKYAMLTTTASDGTLHSRPLTTLEAEFDGDLRFIVAADSDLAQEVRARSQVNLGYADPRGNTYVSVSGDARVTHDPTKAKALWNGWADGFFPGGPDDPQVGVLEVQVRSAQYWSIPGGVLGKITAYVKAVSGNVSDLAETDTVEF